MMNNYTMIRKINFSVTMCKALTFLVLMLIAFNSVSAQTYINGNLSTGAINSSGASAPPGSTWSEVQQGNSVTTLPATNGSWQLADDFFVCSNWKVTRFTFFGIVPNSEFMTTTPFNSVKLAIYASDPSIGSPTAIFTSPNTTNGSYSSSGFANMYRVSFASAARDAKIWQIEANLPGTGIQLTANTRYWVVFSLGTTSGTQCFVPTSTVPGTTTQFQNNAKRKDLSTGNWTSIVDGNNNQPQDLPFYVTYSAPSCSGTPTPGNTLSSVAAGGTVCPNDDFTLYLSTPPCGAGITYQWQYLPSGSTTWLNITNATNTTFSTSMSTLYGASTIPASTQFRAQVKCSTNIANSNPLTLQSSPFYQCYCVPGFTNSEFDDIAINVTVAGINNNSNTSPPNGYSDYTNVTWPAPLNTNYGNLYKGASPSSPASNPISVTIPYGFVEAAAVWVDYNHNSVFDADEYTAIGITPSFGGGTGQGPGGVLRNFIRIPSTALTGITRLRVRIQYLTQLFPTETCNGYTWGETEDYLVNIQPQTLCDAATTIQPLITSFPSACNGDSVNIYPGNYSALQGIRSLVYQWQFSTTGSAPWTNIAGATSVLYTPVINSTRYYRLVASCNNLFSPGSDTTSPILISLKPGNECPCSSISAFAPGSDITNVTLGTLNNSSGCSSIAPGQGTLPNKYSNYTEGLGAPSAPQLNQGSTIPFSVSMNQCGQPGGSSNLTTLYIWIDFNRDGIFTDADELVYNPTSNDYNANYPRTISGNITIPATASTGLTVMRIVNSSATGINACSLYGYGETEDYLVNISAAAPCNTNTPAGIITSSVNPVCASTPFTLSATNLSGFTGITYQWQSSPNGTTWTNIPAASGGTATTYNGTISATTQYRLITTCIAGGTDQSNPITINLSTTNCYCVPPVGSCTSDYIDSVWMGGVGNQSACTPGGYSSFVGSIDNMSATRGGPNAIKIRSNNTGGPRYVSVWIDYNKSGTFESSEHTALGIVSPGVIFTGAINIPITAQTGFLRMRVRMRGGTQFASNESCNVITIGETEDYQIDVAGCQPVQLTQFSGSQTINCGSNAYFWVDASASSAITYKWLFRTGNTGPWSPVVNGVIFSGSTTDSLILTAPNLTYNGYNFCVAMRATCTSFDTSQVMVLNVSPSGNVNFATQPPAIPSVNCAGNGSIGFTLSPVPAGTTIQWQVKTSATAPWINLTANANFGAVTTNTLTLTNVPITFNGYKFRAYVNSTCFAPDTTSIATLTVVGTNLSLSISTPTTTVCRGSAVTFTAAPTPATGLPSPGFKWYVNNIATATSASVGRVITVDNTAMLNVGSEVNVVSGTGAFAANTIVTQINSPTTFTVDRDLIAPLASGSVVSGLLQNSSSTTFTTSRLIGEPEVKCVLLVNDPNGCVVPNPATSNIIDMVITDNVPTSVDLTGPTSVCQGAPVTFTAIPSGASGTAPTYQFLIGNNIIRAYSTSPSFTPNTLTNGDIVKCFMLSNATNCPAPLPARDSITMTVNPSPAVSVTLNASPGVNVCPGTQVTFTATGISAGSAPTYIFKKGTQVLQSGSSATYITSSLANNDVITCVLNSSISTCATGNPATSNALTMSVSNQVASVSLSASPSLVCAGVPVTYTATPGNGGGTPTYQFFVNGSPRTGTGNTFTYTPTDNDSISVAMTSALPCALPRPTTAFIIQDLRESPTAAIEASTVTCGAGYVVLDPGASIGTGATITGYQWQLNGSNIPAPSGTGEFLYATTNGSYVINITASNGCTFASPAFSLSVPTAATALSGSYSIGDVTATNASGSGTTITVTSTANLVVGALLFKTAGTGTLAPNTIITQIINGTQFKVNVAPTVALSGASLAGRTCTNYESFATAISDLNARSISGNCTFDVTAGHTETLTQRLDLGRAALNTALNTRSIVFQKSGTGANPTLTAYTTGTGTSTTVPDGMLALSGVDNVTIDGINFTDSAANTTPAAMMEYGIGLFKLSATDGARNNTIKNCSITLNRNNTTAAGAIIPEGSNGIVVLNATSSVPNALAAGGAAGANSNNKFYSNTISNCFNGIVLSGFAATNGGTTPADGDVNNDIGGTSTATGNSILNFGGGTTTLTSSGVKLINQWGANVSYNTINNNNGTGVNHPAALTGITASSGTSANININNNTVTVIGGGATQAVTGIDNGIGIGSPTVTNTVNINNNIITGGYPNMTTGSWRGINNSANPATININNNSVQDVTLPASTTTGTFTGISNSGASTLNMNYNTVKNNTIPGASTNATNIIKFLGISNTAAINTTLNIIGNKVINNTANYTVTSTNPFTMNLIAVGAPTAINVTISNDTITGNKINGGGAACTINCISQTGTSFYTVNNCLISNNSINSMSGTAVATINGYSNQGGIQIESIYNNTIKNLFVTGTSTGQHLIRGIINNTSAGVGSLRNVYGNTIFNLYTNSTSSAIITGINSRVGNSVSIYKNRIYNIFPGQNAATVTVPQSLGKGIDVTAGTTVSIFNNMISLDLTQANDSTAGVNSGTALNGPDVLKGIDLISSTASSTNNVYFNSIYLKGTGITQFGSSGIFHTANATSTTATLDLRNNIIVNECTSVGAGLIVAFRRSAGTAGLLANYASTSNNNNFYSGTASATNLLYSDGTPTGNAQTLTDYKNGVFTAGTIAPRDANSKSVSPDFVSSTDLHLIGISPSNEQLDSTGTPITTSNPDLQTDIDNQARPTPPARPDMGADEFASNSFTGQVNSNATICSGASGTLTLVSFSGTVVRWESSTDSSTWTPIANSASATYNYSNITAPTYFHAIVNNTTLGLTDASQAALLSINPLPQISTTAAVGPYVTTASVCIGGSLQLFGNGTAAPTNTWVSATTSVAGVSLTGLVTGVTAGTSIITYTNNNGCKGNLTLTVAAAPAITGTASVCVGATTQLTGAGTAATTNPWVSATPSVALVSNTGLVTGVSAGTSVITYTNNGGCSITRTVTVNARPTITGNTTLCLNTNTTLVGSPTAATTNAWTSTSSTTVSVNGSGLINALAVGTSTIRYTNSNGCFRDTLVTVVALPVISLTNGGAGVTTVNSCIGAQTNLFSSTTGGTWSSSNTTIATVSVTGVVSALVEGTCNITYVSGGSCSRTVVFNVNPRPNITGTDSVCVGATTQLIGSGTAATSNAWVSLNTSIATVTNNGLVAGVSGGTCSVVYFNNQGCSDTLSIKVNALPIAYNVTGGGSACSSGTGLSVGLSNSQVGFEYQLVRNATINVGSPVDGTGAAIDFGSQTTAGTYTIAATNAISGCTASMTGSATITITTLPTASIAYSATVFCKTLSTAQLPTITGNTTGTFSADPAGLSITPLTGAIVPSTSTAGDYLITYTIPASGGCEAVNATANISITAASVATFSYAGSPYCQTGSNPVPTLGTDAEYGTFSASPTGLVFVPNSNGEVDILASALGTYTVTNTIAAANGCAEVLATSQIVITQTSNTGPLSGVYNIPGTACRDFRTIAAAVSYLNTNGVSGPVTFQVAAGYNETLQSTLALGPLPTANNTSATNRIRFVKTGAGVNPKVTAYEGTNLPNSAAAVDGIWSLRGVDFVTIDGIDLFDPNPAASLTATATGANTGTTINVASTAGIEVGMIVNGTSISTNTTVVSVTNATQFVVNAAPTASLVNGASLFIASGKPMEYGFGLFKNSATDGAQNDSIINSNIALNRANVTPSAINSFNGAVGIVIQGSTAVNSTTLLPATAASGANSNNVILSNTIQNCNVGIAIIGAASGTGGTDENNSIGDTTSTAGLFGNTIINFGGGGDVTTSSPSSGISLVNQGNAKVGNNTIVNNQNGNGVNHINAQFGISTLNTTSGTNIYIKRNNITLIGGADRAYSGIDNQTGGGTNSTVDISENRLSVGIPSNINTISGSVTGIVSSTASNTVTTINLNGNIVRNSVLSGQGSWTGIYNKSNSVSTGIVQMNNNVIDSNSINATGTFVGLQSDASAYSRQNMNGNRITNNNKLNNVAELNWIYQKSASTNSGDLFIEGNVLDRDTVTIAAANASSPAVYGIRITGAKTGATINIANNNINRQFVNDINGANSVTLRAYHSVMIIGQTPTENVYNNKISNLYISAIAGNTGTHNIFGIQSAGSATGGAYTKNIYGNKIDTLYVRQQSGVNSIIAAIHNSGTLNGATLNIYKNKVSHLVPFGTGATTIARGIWIQSTQTNATVNLTNNMVNLDLSAAFDGAVAGVMTAPDAVRGIDIAQAVASTVNMYYNTVRIGGSGGTGFGSSALSIVSNNPVFRLQNNIFVNKASGTAIAMRRAAASTTTNYLPASSNNLYYAGAPGTNNLLYSDAGTTFQTLSGAWVAGGREANSIGTFDPVFASAADFSDSLHLNINSNCDIESKGVIIASVTDDIDGEARSASTPDIGADEANLPKLEITTQPQSASTCINTTTAGLSVVATINSTATITYQWYSNTTNSNQGGTSLGASANSATYVPSVTTAGTFYYYVEVSVPGCGSVKSSVATFVVNNPANITITNNTGSSELNCTTTSINVTATGGVSYVWDNSLGNNAAAVITSAGTYTVTGTDANGCTNTAQIVITASSDVPTITITNNTGVTELTCTTTSINVTASGGASYSWSNGLGTNASVDIIAPGTYTVTGSSANGCISTSTITITQNSTAPTVAITNNSAVTALNCTVTSINVTATGATNYTWSNGLGSNASVDLIAAGTYTVTGTAANGCTGTASITITQDATLPNITITNNTGVNELSCTTTSINVTASGGLTYVWDNGLGNAATATIVAAGTYTVTGTAANGCTNTAQIVITASSSLPTIAITNNAGTTELTCTTTSISVTATGGTSYVWSNGLGNNANATITAAGTYTVTGTAANGCTNTASITITASSSLPTIAITNNSGSTELTCTTTSISVTATGGTSYVWSNGLGNNANANITAAGTYTVTGTAANGCTGTAQITITSSSTLPTVAITNNTGSTELTCTTTSISVTATGANSYTWSNSLGNNAAATITAPGTYTVTGTAANGCTGTATITITENTTAPTISITNNTGGTQLSCTTNSINVTANGGSTYVWSNGLGNNAAASITAAGTYTVTGTAANGCTGTAQIIITASSSLPTVTITNNTGVTELSCITTSISVTATGANSYTWNNGLGSNASVTITSPGTYIVTGTDLNGCSASAQITITQNTSTSGSWLGASTNWNDPANWCGGVLPTASTNVNIPAGLTNYPVINTGATTPTPLCANLTIATGARIDLQIGGKMTVHGSITTASGAVFNALDGTIEMAGSAPQTIAAGSFQNNNLRNLIINNASVTLGDSLNLFGKLSFSGSNRTFNATNGKFTLKSTATLTASVADITKDINTQAVISGNQITGDVTVERFISARRAWRLLSMPTKHNLQTIQQSFQENGVQSSNPAPGFGTILGSNRASWLADGFDVNSPGATIQMLNPQTNSWVGIVSTKNVTTPTPSSGRFEQGKAYFTFIRGNRSVTTSTQPPTTTILREKGALQTGSYTANLSSTASGQNVGVGNPYASPVDFRKLTLTGVQNLFYVWDPLLGVSGAYQACNVVGGNIVVAPGGGSYANGNFNIQSGQGFIVVANAPTASVTFNESSKVDSNNLVSRYSSYGAAIRTQLYQVQNGNPVLFDGVLNMYDETYNDQVDDMDVKKLTNTGENISIVSGGKQLSMEGKRGIGSQDTIFYNLSNMKLATYQLNVIPEQLGQSGLQAYLEDSYMQSRTAVDMSNGMLYNFIVNNEAASYASSRFRIVFRSSVAPPAISINVKSEIKEKEIIVDWDVQNASNIRRYVVERSVDGNHFEAVSEQPATILSHFVWVDQKPMIGLNNYRIKAIDNAGRIFYSNITKTLYKIESAITVYPNPIKSDRILKVRVENPVSGEFTLNMFDISGKVILTKNVNHPGGIQTYTMQLDGKMAKGTYSIEVVDALKNKSSIKVQY